MKTKITHLTSVHPRYDTRIFIKECGSLAKVEGNEVNLIVADGLGDEENNGVHIIDVGKLQGRMKRIFKTSKNIFTKAVVLNSDIYHFHDPELIPVGLKLKKLGKKVIFDIHENVVQQIKDKEYLNYYVRNFLSSFYAKYEKRALRKFDMLVLAEDSYVEYYSKLSDSVVVILNMPDIEPLKKYQVDNRDKNELFYIGGISNVRGLDVTIEAIKILKESIPDIYMHYIGSTYNNILETIDMKSIQNNIKFYGAMPLFEGLELSKDAKVGLSILKPIGNYTKSYSTKVFEYMALGLPVVTSNFELYKNIVEKYNCGLCINPLDPKEIADAIAYIIDHPKEAKEMGENGKKAVLERYNWSMEEKKLFEIYEELV